MSEAEVAARGICRVRAARARDACDCEIGAPCRATDRYGMAAVGAVSALRLAGLLPPLPANRPCVERSETGSCLACEAKQGEPCQHPALKL